MSRWIDGEWLLNFFEPYPDDYQTPLGTLRACVDDAPTIDAVSEWIPCSERLPEYRELVIITTRDLRVRLAYLDSIYGSHTDDLWDMPLDNAGCALWNVVAWMPLPEPWKGAEAEG